jgi:hypothetical protein
MVLGEFRQRYPQGSLVSKLIDIDRGIYIVKVSVVVDNITLATGLAGRERVETAEDAARERAIAALMLNSNDLATQNNLNHIAQETIPTNNEHDNENIDTVNSANYSTAEGGQPQAQPSQGGERLTKKEAQADPIVFNSEQKLESSIDESIASQLNSEPEVKAEILPEEVIIPAPKSSIAASANLFEGTSNIDMISNHSLKDLDNIPDSSPLNSTEDFLDAENLAEINFNEIKHKTDLEIKRLGWTKDDGREFLKSRYGKRSRLQLTDNQLLEFLQYLESQPNPN